MNKASLLALVLGLNGASAFALKIEKKSEGKSSIKIEEVTEKKNKVDGDIDEEITNAKLRAESGSKSKFSLSLVLGYYGGTVSKPFAAERPALTKRATGLNQTLLSSDFSARYRWTKNDSLTLGVGMGLMTPFQTETSINDRVSFSDPSIDYSRVAKIGSIQNVTGFSVAVGASQDSKSQSLLSSYSLNSTGLRSFDNGLTLGVRGDLSYSAYGNDPAAKEKRANYGMAVYPFAEYALSDKFSLRTLFGKTWSHVYGEKKDFAFRGNDIYQSFGVGISASRDVYFYPNIQYVPGDAKLEKTNVAVSATVNMF